MIILIDGPLGVGKSTVAGILQEKLQKYSILVMDADDSRYKSFCTLNPQDGDLQGATTLRYHTTFCRNFGLEVVKEADKHDIVIVPMCLEGKVAKEQIRDYLLETRNDVYHFVLTVSLSVLKERVENDDKDSRQKDQAVNSHDICMMYIEQFFQDANLLINTDNLSADLVASKIMEYIDISGYGVIQ